MDAQDFFSHWFRHSLDPLHGFTVWSLPSKKTQWFTDVAAAVAYAHGLKGAEDVYFGVCPMTQPSKGRGVSSDVVALPGFWLDIDFRGDGHKKDNLPKGVADAERIFEEFGLRPSIIAHSGGGVQAYWLAKRPAPLATDEDREKAHALTRRFHATVLAICEGHGWTLDATHDLTRVFRVPGTSNMKTGAERPVRILWPIEDMEPVRSSWDDLTALLLPEPEKKPRPHERTSRISVVKVGEPAVPPDFIEMMCDSDKRFRDTWSRKRKDIADQSLSSYDLALANMLVLAEKDDQSICDVIRAFRQKHGSQEEVAKGNRRDYLMRTISRARNDMEGQAVVKRAEALGGGVGDMEDLRKVFRVDVECLVKSGKHDARYSLRLTSGEEILIGSGADLQRQSVVRQRIMDATGVRPTGCKPPQWEFFLNTLLDNRVECAENDPVEIVLDVLQAYFSEYPPVRHDTDGEEYYLAGATGKPIITPDEITGLSEAHWRRYFIFAQSERVSANDMRQYLRGAGFSPRNINFRHKELKAMNRSYWLWEETV